jgi:hypothetical protein
MSSWIVLTGRLIVNFGAAEEILSAGAVMHLRGLQSANARALENSMLVEVTYSSFCKCDKPGTGGE